VGATLLPLPANSDGTRNARADDERQLQMIEPTIHAPAQSRITSGSILANPTT
jgi:hypothetical protein